MSNRIALFASKKEVEDFFDFQTGKESIFTPHYNMAPGQYITTISRETGKTEIERSRWGISGGNNGEEQHNIDIEAALNGLRDGTFRRCIIPVSGYYKWKEAGRRADHPFFIRMLDEAIMALAGVLVSKPDESGSEHRRCAIIQTESNALVHPLSPYMPLQFNRELTQKWLDEDSDPVAVIKDGQNLFLLTDMTVLRVSRKVNDLSVNSPKLIQPLPK